MCWAGHWCALCAHIQPLLLPVLSCAALCALCASCALSALCARVVLTFGRTVQVKQGSQKTQNTDHFLRTLTRRFSRGARFTLASIWAPSFSLSCPSACVCEKCPQKKDENPGNLNGPNNCPLNFEAPPRKQVAGPSGLHSRATLAGSPLESQTSGRPQGCAELAGPKLAGLARRVQIGAAQRAEMNPLGLMTAAPREVAPRSSSLAKLVPRLTPHLSCARWAPVCPRKLSPSSRMASARPDLSVETLGSPAGRSLALALSSKGQRIEAKEEKAQFN